MNILFISHDAHLAGAQILLLNLLEWLKQNHPEIKFDILLASDGMLTDKFAKVATVYHVPSQRKKAGKLEKVWCKFKLKKFYEKVTRKKYDLIYNNTFSNGNILLKFNQKPIITHVHELEYWIRKNGAENQTNIKSATTYYLAASQSVKNYLMTNNIATEEKIEVVYEWIDTQNILNQASKRSIKAFLGLPHDSIIIAASGRENFRKGKDWFIPVAIEVLTKMRNTNIHFVWIGGTTTEEIVFDTLKSGFANNIHFIEHIADASSYFNEFEVFMMLSREDPFPLVNLEAAVWEVPVICFQGAGGTEELISENCGIKVPYGNLNLFSQAVINILQDKEMKNQIGINIKEKVIREYDLAVVGQKIVNAIVKVSKENE